ncbi:MAG: hypothetical protein HZC23_13420 [Rhodocyclales bacterium]|nr:hypothetical protein [Rhodocyclales bacterium]
MTAHQLSFEEAFVPVSDRGKRVEKRAYLESGQIPVVDQGEGLIGGYTDNEAKAYDGPLPVLVFGDHTRRIKFVDFPFAVGAQGVKLLKPRKCWHPKFIAYQLTSLRLDDRGYSRHYQLLRKETFVCPPIDEQRRIVAEIEEQLSRLEAGVTAIKRVQANLKRYRSSAISEPFTALEGKGHVDWQTGREVFEFITSGSRGWAKYYSDSGALFLRVGNVRRENIQLELGDIQRVAPPLGAEGLRTQVAPGDILVTITADVGRVGLVSSQLGEAFVNQHVALVRPRTGFNPRYLAWYLASRVGNQQLRLNERGATRTGLGLDDILAARIPFIDNIEQDRVAAEIDRRLSVVEELETQVHADLARAERLRQAILSSAFSSRSEH